MPQRWLSAVLARIRERAVQRKARFTLKALRELAALNMGLDEEDACDVKVILRSDCVVISFHEEEDQSHEDN